MDGTSIAPLWPWGGARYVGPIPMGTPKVCSTGLSALHQNSAFSPRFLQPRAAVPLRDLKSREEFRTNRIRGATKGGEGGGG